MSDFTELLTINPETIGTVAPILVNNWDRKVEVETSYDTIINSLDDGTEQRLGRKIRPHRFEYLRLTSVYKGDLQEMTTFALRACDQVSQIPVYSDATAVTDLGLGILKGDFQYTRFFPGGRVVLLQLDGFSKVIDQEILTVSVSQDAFIILDSPVTLTGSVLTAIPLMDCDIELRSVNQDATTGTVASIDLNINEKMNSSALVPLSAPTKTEVFFDDFNTIGLDPENWPTGSGTIVNGQLVLADPDYLVESLAVNEANFQVTVPYSISSEGGETGVIFKVRAVGPVATEDLIISHYRDPDTTLKTQLTIDGSTYLVSVDDSSSGTFEIFKYGSLVVFTKDDIVLGAYTTTSTEISTLELSVPNNPSTIDVRVSSASIFDSPIRQFLFDPDSYEGLPVFSVPHNWADRLQVDFFRDGTRTDFGRGRIVVVDSIRPQYQFSLSSLLNRQEVFDFLRFFDWSRGRLAPFWFKNPQELWRISSVSTGEVKIKAYRSLPADILDFYSHIWIRATDGTESILEISDVTLDGTDLAIQTPSAFDVLKTWVQCSSAHLVRFKADSLREVWTNREVCEISFSLIELLEEPPVSPDFIWGGLPNTLTDEFVFGGFPDTVYALNGYWGGQP